MSRRLLIFAVGCVAACLVLLGPAWLLGGARGAGNLSIAAALCGVPAIMTLAVVELLAGANFEKQAAAHLGGSILRMGFVLAGAAILVKVFPELVAGGDLLFWGWVILFYLFTLAWEVVFIVGHRPAAKPAPPPETASPGQEPNTVPARAN
jgi:hypothetical protein